MTSRRSMTFTILPALLALSLPTPLSSLTSYLTLDLPPLLSPLSFLLPLTRPSVPPPPFIPPPQQARTLTRTV